jgi:hypothetical protein
MTCSFLSEKLQGWPVHTSNNPAFKTMSLVKYLKIADFLIQLKSEIPVFIDEGYLPFAVNEGSLLPDLILTCLPILPEMQFDKEYLLFEASNSTGILYRIHRHNDGLAFFLYDQQKERVLQQILLLDSGCKKGTVYSHPESDGQFDVMKYPLGPILIYYLTARNNAVLIHASGVFDGHKGRLFTGFSGIGKSTMASLWKSAGNRIVNDDRLVIRKMGNAYIMYNTPMYYPDEPKLAPLHAIHLIRHEAANTMERTTGAKAISKVMAFCIQNNYDASLIGNNAGFIAGMAGRIPVYSTGFVPDLSAVTYISEHED